MTIDFDAEAIDWKKVDGLIPAVIQDAKSLRVLMLGYFNRDAIKLTLENGLVTFFSRTKQRLWQKGETSGNVLKVLSITLDCDQDTLLLMVEPHGPTCHRGTETCFSDLDTPSLSVLADLIATIRDRHANPQEGSYTSALFEEGLTRIAQKVGEEGVETALAAATKSNELVSEAADLIFHLLVLLEASGSSLYEILSVLHNRSRKASR